MEFIAAHTNQITFLLTIFAGCFAFIKWLDSRNQNLRDARYQKYVHLIRILSGSKESSSASICMTEQIAAAWLLLEYREYFQITLKILDNSNLEKMSNKPWQEFVLPEIKKMVQEIKSHKRWCTFR